MTQGNWGQPSGVPTQSPWGSSQPAQPFRRAPTQQWTPQVQPSWPQPGPPGWQQPGPTWQAPPPRSPIATVLLAAAVVTALGFGAFAITSALVGQDSVAVGPVETSAAPTSPAEPSPQPTAEPSPTAPEPSPTPTADPDEYDPPPLPTPEGTDDATQWLQANALYDQTTTQTDCAVPRLTDSTPPDLAVMDDHLRRSMDCLQHVWLEPMTAAGFVLPLPPVRSYDQPITTACGTSPAMEYAAAFYCPADQRIFYAVNRDYRLFNETSLEIDTTLAHELGHALQGRTGMLSAELWLTHDATDDVVLEYSRRIELQANCFGGVAMNALSVATGLTGAERESLNLDAYYRGDREGGPRTHGNPDSARRWMEIGLGNLRAGACNTFIVSQDEIA